MPVLTSIRQFVLKTKPLDYPHAELGMTRSDLKGAETHSDVQPNNFWALEIAVLTTRPWELTICIINHLFEKWAF